MQKENYKPNLDLPFDIIDEKNYDENYFENLIKRWLPFTPILLIFVLCSLISTWGYLRYTPKVYESKAQILIKEDKDKAQKDNIMDALDLFGSQIKVENEIAVLKSKKLMREVVAQIGVYAELQFEGRVDRILLYDETAPIIVKAYNTDSLQYYSEKIQINKNGVVWGKEFFPYDTWCNTKAGILKFTKRFEPLDKNPLTFYTLIIRPVRSIASYFSSQLEITPVSKQSTVLQLSLTDVNMFRGRDVLNTLIQSYANDDIIDKNRLAKKTIHFLNERLRLVSHELETVEGELQQFKQNNKAIDLTGQSQYFLRKLEENDKKAVELDIQLTTLKQVEAYINRRGGQEGAVPALYTLQDNIIRELLSKLLETESQYQKLTKSSGQNTPNTKILEALLEKYRKAINENLSQQMSTLLAATKRIDDNNKNIQLSIAGLPSKERSLLDISRRQTVKDNLFSYLLQKREEAQLSYESAIADSRVIDAAESSSSPIAPQVKKVYIVALSIALFAFIIIIGSYIYIGAKLMFRNELELFVKLPVIATIGKMKSSSRFVFNEPNKRSWLSEQFRNFRTDITFLGFNGVDKKVLLITSSIPGEGKTFIAVNLAIAASLLGQKVILINADLRNPKLHELFSTPIEPGLSNFLAGSIPVTDVILNIPEFENLSIIPCGTIPPNPSELLGNKRMEELIIYLKEHYDFIILDSTPSDLVTDSKVVARLCEATLIITRYGFTPLRIVKGLKEINREGIFPNPAIVFNAVGGFGIRYGYYGYKYYKYEYYAKSNKNDFFTKMQQYFKSKS